jgi:opacity protein-like surface antigen
MKSLRILSLIALVLAVTPLMAADFGIRAGRYTDSGEEFVGAEVLFDAGSININPNIEYLLADDDVTAGTINLDVTVDVATVGAFTPYLGAGLGLSYTDTDIVGTTTDVVGNLIGGVTFNLESLKPYAQVKYFRTLEDEDGDNDEIALTIGLRF